MGTMTRTSTAMLSTKKNQNQWVSMKQPTAVEELRGFGVEVETTKHLVTHGNIGTAAGCLAAVDLMGWAIEKLYGPEIRKDVIASVLPVGQGQACIY